MSDTLEETRNILEFEIQVRKEQLKGMVNALCGMTENVQNGELNQCIDLLCDLIVLTSNLEAQRIAECVVLAHKVKELASQIPND